MPEAIKLSPEEAQQAISSASQPIKLSPEEQSQAISAAQEQSTDLLRSATPDELVDMQKEGTIDIPSAFAGRPDLQKDPEAVARVADAFHKLREQPWYSDLPGPAKIAENVGGIVKGMTKYGVNLAQQATGGVSMGLAKLAGMAGLVDATPEELNQAIADKGREVQQNAAEAASATELATTGLVGQAARAGQALLRVPVVNPMTGQVTQISKPLEQFTPTDKATALFDAAARVTQSQQIASGHGALLNAVGPEVVKNLEANGMGVRPQEVSELAQGDPFSWEAMGKGMSTLPSVAIPGAGKLATDTVGGGLTVAGKVAPAAGAVAGAALGAKAGAHIPFLGEVAEGVPGAGPIAGGIFGAKKGLQAGRSAGKFLQDLGEQIKGTPKGAYGALAKDIVEASPRAAGELAKGAAFDLALASGSETPQEKESVGMGTAFGALGAARAMGGHVLSGQLIGPRDYGTAAPVSSSGKFAPLDQMHSSAFSELDPGQRARVNAVRLFLSKANPSSDVFVGKNPAEIEAALVASGETPERAKIASEQAAATSNVRDKDGNVRKVITLQPDTIGAAPHEARHAMEDVLGEDTMRQFDEDVKKQYAPMWEQFGNYYTGRLTGVDHGANWRDALLDSSGWGNAEAVEKLFRDAKEKFRTETEGTGKPMPTDADIRNQVRTDFSGQPVDWRSTLTPEEAKIVADRYIARELGAENFDAVFKHTGPSLEGGNQLPEKAAQLVGGFLESLGVNPVAGRTSEGLHAPLDSTLARQTLEQGKSQAGGQIVVPKVTPRAKVSIPSTPEAQQEAADEAKKIAADAPDTAPPPTTNPQGQTVQGKSPRELLGAIAEAIAQRSGVKLNYLSAPDEPAAAVTSNRNARRSMIEAFRTMPAAARALWEKTFFPERVLQTKNGKYQVMGWSPEVFAANAHKLAQTLSKLSNIQLPYDVDPTTKSFTPEAWKQLYEDAQTFVQNQKKGQTGSGEQLVVPKSASDAGAFAPPTQKGAVALDQRKADIINMLFNLKLPETPRVQGGKVPLNILAQEVSTATIPGRVEAPVRPRGEFSGPKAEALGIEGRPILEVNPVRNELEAAAKAAGVEVPSFIESIQRLNLDNIKEVEHAPEAPEFRGNTLTLTSGFMPKDLLDRLEDPSPTWADAIKNYQGKHGGGATGFAFDAGAEAKTPEDIAAFKHAQEKFHSMSRAAMAEKDFGNALGLATKSQLAREAYEAATGEGGSVDMIRKKVPDYQPPLAEKPLQALPNSDVAKVAEDYAKEKGIELRPSRAAQTNEPLLKGLADFYQGAKHSPQAKDVKASYNALAQETADQYDAIQRAGYTLEPFTGEGEPYKSSAEMTEDVRKNKHLFFLPTQGNFSGPEANLMLRPSGVDGLSVNDMFRAVHDFFGHAKEGYQFGPKGEFNAWREHSQMHSPEAQGALAAETLAQNAWVNFGSHLRGEGGKIPQKGEPGFIEPAKRPFAEQKNLIVPQAFREEAAQFLPSDNPRAVRTPAIRDEETSKVWEGPMGHWEAMTNMSAAGVTQDNVTHGFVTNDGEFLNRAEAFQRATELGQYKPVSYGGMPQTKELESQTFARQQMLKEQGYEPDVQALPRKSKQDWELKIGPGMFSKAWILPDGKPVQLGGQWHHEWVNENPDVVKKYGFKPTTNGEENRVGALKKGFARVNYAKNSGSLFVEARLKDWQKIAPSIKQLAQSNLGKIDNMVVNLLDDTAKRIVEQDGVALHTYNADEKMDHLPLISEPTSTVTMSPQASSQVSTQFLPKSFPKEADFKDEKTLGQTLRSPGWALLTATQESRGAGTDEVNKTANENLEKALIADGFNPIPTKGLYKGVDQGANFIVPGMTPEQAKEWGTKYGQESVLTPDGLLYQDGSINPAKHDETVIGPEAKKQDFYSQVEGGPAFSMGIDFSQKTQAMPGEQTTFSGEKDIKKPLANSVVASMTRQQLLDHYPEAIVPKKRDETIPSEIANSPLAKKGGTKAYADKLVEFAKTQEADPAWKAGTEWYSKFTPLLKKEFGEDSQLMAELLAATSPRNTPKQNFAYAVEALEGWKKGKFDRHVSKFNEGLAKLEDGTWEAWAKERGKEKPTQAGFMADWIDEHDLKPRQSNGALYGMHSVPVLRVLARKWFDTAGPKTKNFIQNLVGTKDDATIDVWADRTMRRLGYEGTKERWRILPLNTVGVSDKDFAFSQQAFRKAAEQLGITPDALQGGLWFAEKKLWADRGWGILDLGDFRKEFERLPQLREGINERLEEKPEASQQLNLVEPRKQK